MTTRRRALLVGTQNYRDFAPLLSTSVDLAEFSKVLAHPEVGGFEVEVRLDRTASEMHADIASFLGSGSPNELMLVYITGHGLRNLEDGEFYFAATDTHQTDPATSGMSASFFNEELEGCEALQKVAILDCCYSASSAVGFRSTVAKSGGSTQTAAAPSPIKSRGVFVLASSGVGETSAAGEVSASGVKPSAFTAALVHGLQTGQADRDDDGYISVSELFHHAREHIQKQSLDSIQTPHHSAIGVTAELIVARNCRSRPLTLKAVSPHKPMIARQGSSKEQQWAQLLKYYRDCVKADNDPHSWLKPSEEGYKFVGLRGKERLLSGDIDIEGLIPVPSEAKGLVENSDLDKVSLWCGYPMVALPGERRDDIKLAPLVVRRLDVIDNDGQTFLEPYGPVEPHPRLVAELLSDDDKDALVKSFTQEWPPGGHHQMAQALRHLLIQDLEIADVEKLDPLELSERLDLRSAAIGARNTAVIFQAKAESSSTRNLLNELEWIAENPRTIHGTALGALLDDDRHLPATNYDLVTPMLANAGQRAIVDAAMTRRLTVGTGPPGTGKTQLVVNLAATAIGNNQSVLVASTNNEAVDEVWRRSEQLAPGAIVRTGSAENGKPKEKASLAELQRLRANNNVQTAKASLLIAHRDDLKLSGELDVVARAELRLAQLGQLREQLAGDLGMDAGHLSAIFAGDAYARVSQLAGTWFFPTLRRRKWLRKMGLDLTPSKQTFEQLARFSKCEKQFRDAHHMGGKMRDQEFSESLARSDERVRDASKNFLNATVARNAQQYGSKIAELVQASSTGNDRSVRGQVLPAIRGWAVTSLSAGCFPTKPRLFDLVIVDEASQCSIPSMVPLLYRAKRALIIGDPMQLAHISNVPAVVEARTRREHNIDAAWLEQHRLSYTRHSAYRAAERRVGEPLLLAEHFRCHPDIIRFSNDHFYGGRLRILTDSAPRARAANLNALRWFDIKGTPHKTPVGWVNRAEVQHVRRLVQTLLERLPSGSRVGVVTPLRAHKDALAMACRGLDSERIRVGTVHTFQGGECDAVVFSLAASDDMSLTTVSWLEGQLNLWNVAITRAKSHLLVAGDRTFWQGRPGVGRSLVEACDRGSDPPGDLLPLQQLLFEKLHPHLPVELSVTRNGYLADAVVGDPGQEKAVSLDAGHVPSEFAADHLRLQLEKARLLGSARRLPAWRLYDDAALYEFFRGN